MKIAIHNQKGSYSDEWIRYCKEKEIPYKIVNCYDNDIIKQVQDCDALMWHHNHAYPEDVLFAKQLLFSLEMAGKTVYPDWKTGWHFDDKLGQKYLLEAMGLPLIPSFAFYSKKEAVSWISSAKFPLVFKLRGGAGSRNVKLIKNKSKAKRIINKAFGKGIRQYDPWGGIKENLRKLRKGSGSSIGVLKAIAHIAVPIKLEKSKGREKGYVYFQEFIPGLEFDIRVQMVGNRSYAMVRKVRENDFRASGGGNIDYDGSKVAKSAIKLSQDVQKALQMQTMAIDLLPFEDSYRIAEISYAYGIDDGELEPGHWSSDLVWHPGKINPFGWMVDDVIKKHNEQNI